MLCLILNATLSGPTQSDQTFKIQARIAESSDPTCLLSLLSGDHRALLLVQVGLLPDAVILTGTWRCERFACPHALADWFAACMAIPDSEGYALVMLSLYNLGGLVHLLFKQNFFPAAATAPRAFAEHKFPFVSRTDGQYHQAMAAAVCLS